MTNNRSQGWKHAKISGHINEKLIAENLGEEYQTLMTKVESIFGDKTPPKRDIYGPSSISIKKSRSGQVFLTPSTKFIAAYEMIYDKIPEKAKNCILLLFGNHSEIEKLMALPELTHSNVKIRRTETERKTMCVDTIKKYDESLLIECLLWFSQNIDKVTSIVFERGYAKNTEDWANLLMYKNLLGENDIDEVFEMSEFKKRCLSNNHISFGIKNGGTTMNLPFGHLQYHQGMMQFHHNYDKIRTLFKTENTNSEIL